MSRKDQKKSKQFPFQSPSDSKLPKSGNLQTIHHCSPELRAGQMDMDGPWGWSKFDPLLLQNLLHKIFDSQKLTWQILRENGSHLVQVGDLCSKAQKRLFDLSKDDCDELFSLRVTGKQRIWGIKDGSILWLLWWDPNHEVCPSHKKHT
jgi:hypothetical protein